MPRIFLTLSFITLLATGCDDSSLPVQSSLHPTTEQKPVVTVVPIIDSSQSDYSWNLSDELSSFLYTRFSQQDLFYLVDLSEAQLKRKKLTEVHNPFGTDLSWIKKAFQGDEFVVFLELLEHDEVIRKDRSSKSLDPKMCAADLKMAMRIRVFDLRGKEPNVILQEIVRHCHFIPRSYTKLNFEQVSWKQENYSLSPLAIAHRDFMREIAERLEGYILLN